MRRVYIVSYDICKPSRWRKVYKVIQGYGTRLQYSVFRCELLPEDKVRLVAKIDKLIHHEEDQVLVVDLGLQTGQGNKCIEAYGVPCHAASRVPVVV